MISPPVGGPTRMDCPKGVNHSRAHQLSGINMKQGSSAIASRSRSRGPLPSAGGDDTPCIGLSPPDLSCTSDVQSSFFSSQPSSLLKDLSTSPAATEFYDAVAEPSKTDARRSTKKHCFLTDMCCCGCLQSWKSSTGKPESEPLKQRPVLDNCCTGSRVRYHVRVAGPSMSGKTAFLRYLKHGQFSPTQPTKDIEVSRVVWQDCSFVMWDSRKLNDVEMKHAVPMSPNLAKDLKKRSLIAAHHTMNAIIYVVDASDPGRLKIAGRDFERLLRRYHSVPVVLVLGAKADKAGSMDHKQIQARLRLLETAYDRECALCLISSVTGDGIPEAMNWMQRKMRQREGFWSSISRGFCSSRDAEMQISCPVFGFATWDPFSCCRYSRLSS